MKQVFTFVLFCSTLLAFTSNAQKPVVWIYSDISDKTIPGKNKEHTTNDPDDISALAAYLLLANEFDTKAIVVASTHRNEHKTSANQAEWAKRVFGGAYAKDLPQLNAFIGGYPDSILYLQSCIKESGERYNPKTKYKDIRNYSTVQALLDTAKRSTSPIYVLCWGSLTEPAILINHCLTTNNKKILDKLIFIGHWTNSGLHQGTPERPEDVANCREDANACAYIKEQAKKKAVKYYECGAIGQHGIVSGGYRGRTYYNQFLSSALGSLFVNGKYVFDGVDFSDAATYFTLLGRYGVGLKNIASDGTNSMEKEKENERLFDANAKKIHDDLLERAQKAVPSASTFRNPVIGGYHPDPSVCRVGNDYYLVNSSFEFYPGLPIFHSTDLVNWNLIGYGINRPDQVVLPEDLKDSRGIYAPAIRYHDGKFYIITTCVNCDGNFYITADNPAGPWSDPVWLKNASGIDPTLFWDDDGKCYYVGHGKINGPKDWPNQEGIWIQELDLKTNTLLGSKKQITHGHATNARWTEGPHIYKINGKYMLLVAEGGTGFHHAVTVFHADSIFGPYIPDHSNPILTHRHLGQEYPIHSTGHADIFQTQFGDWWMVLLGKRQDKEGKTLLGRETFLVPMHFEGQTPVVNNGIGKILSHDKAPKLPRTKRIDPPARDNFDSAELNLHWNMVRSPKSKWHTLADGKLTLQLRPENVDSLGNPSMLIRRLENHVFSATTSMKFKPTGNQEAAGLILYRASTNYIQFVRKGNDLVLMERNQDVTKEVSRVPYTADVLVLGVRCKDGKITFTYGDSDRTLKQLGKPMSYNVLTDEETLGFTGPFVGIYASSNGKASSNTAAFDWFEYHELETDYTPDNLPDYMERITDFGERADFSPDGKRIAFMGKTFGDAYEIDLETRKIKPLTQHFFHHGFQRVMYLPNGDYLLTGADFFDVKEPWKARSQEHCQVWVLSKNLSSPPVPLGIKIKEGIAIARNSMRIAWVKDPDLFVGEIKYEQGKPVLVNQQKVVSESDLPAPVANWKLEPQNFRPPFEDELIFNAHFAKINHESEVMGVHLNSKKIVNYSGYNDLYNEPETIFPTGEATLVEANHHRPTYKDLKSWNMIDLYKLELDGSKNFRRITYFNDNENYKASNPVISPDGRYIAFQYARLTDVTGIGHGIILLDLWEFEKLAKGK